MVQDFTNATISHEIVDRMATAGLRMSLLDTADLPAFESWIRAMARGFHEPNPNGSATAAERESKKFRRITAVWELDSSPTDEPVGTVSSWPVDFTVSPGRTTQAWAISSVSVASTHRRRGIARALLAAELAAASDLGHPLAILTVSESTIYGRFGFAPAAFVSHLSLETHRAAMVGFAQEGRVRFVSIKQARELLPKLHDRVRVQIPGQIGVWGGRWDELVGCDGAQADRAKSLRAVRYEDAEGDIQGVAVYRVAGGEEDFTKHVLHVEYLLSATPDAYSALWRFMLSVDLVSHVKAGLRAVDEPIRWQLADQRALTETREDHLWARILDVAAALEARGYSADGCVGFDVYDDLEYAAGRFLLTVTEGRGSVERLHDDFAAGIPVLTLAVNELSALYLGGVSATTLERAGRVVASTEDACTLVDTVFRAQTAPWLDVWF